MPASLVSYAGACRLFPAAHEVERSLRLSNNLSGQYKRGVGMALHIGIGNFSGAIASNVFLAKDAPRYIMGRMSCLCVLSVLPRSDCWVDAIMLMFVGIGFVTVPLAVFLYSRINRERDRKQAEGGIKYTDKELRQLGDRAPDFRYIL
jgi:hypothetical protein